MTKVYMIRECGGSYEDKWDRFHSAYFNLNKAEAEVTKLESDWKLKQDKLSKLDEHYDNCQLYLESTEFDENGEPITCPICEERDELVWEMEDGKYYKLEEIEVE